MSDQPLKAHFLVPTLQKVRGHHKGKEGFHGYLLSTAGTFQRDICWRLWHSLDLVSSSYIDLNL